MTTPEELLELQLTDTAIDLIRHRLPRLPQVLASQSSTAALEEWERQDKSLRARIGQFESVIAASEKANEAITAQRARLEQQLKTVIAARPAEALMHEIEVLNSKRSALDDAELEAMDGLAQAESELAVHSEAEEALRSESLAAAAHAAAAVAASEAELADKIASRDTLRGVVDHAALGRYDTMRIHLNGVAIARLNGLRCEGCHLDLSRGEVDEIKRSPPEELPECPNCGRLLVR